MDPVSHKPVTRPLSGGPRPDRVLDTVGFYCPVPIIKTSAAVRTMAAGQVLEVVSDDRVILVDMPAWCVSAGHEYVGHFEEEGEVHLFLRKLGRTSPDDGGGA